MTVDFFQIVINKWFQSYLFAFIVKTNPKCGIFPGKPVDCFRELVQVILPQNRDNS